MMQQDEARAALSRKQSAVTLQTPKVLGHSLQHFPLLGVEP